MSTSAAVPGEARALNATDVVSAAIRVLLADDHDTVRHGLRLLIDAQPDMEVVGEARSGSAAIERARSVPATLILLDISMPEVNGVDAAREITATAPGIAIVALSRYTDDSYVQAVLAAGARGYVLKQSPSAELLTAIRAVADGRRYLDAGLTDRLAGSFMERHAPGSPPITDREVQVLPLIAVGYSNKEIAERLDLSVKTVEAHKANAMRKLDLRGRVDIVRYGARHGWLLDA